MRECRALCDTGSQLSFMSESLLMTLNLPRTSCAYRVHGIDQSLSTSTNGAVEVTMYSCVDERFHIKFASYVIKSITTDTPTTAIDVRAYQHLQDIPLADPTFGIPGAVDVLIGADVWPSIILNDVIVGVENEPCALNTRLGWIILGPAASSTSTLTPKSFFAEACESDTPTDQLLQRFWEIDEPTCEIMAETDVCEDIFNTTFTRCPDGRYCVQIPFRSDAPALGRSHPAALRQFLQLERKLASNLTMAENYIRFMREYEDLGHMEALQTDEVDPRYCYYIPHHAVMTKFRVVFNASARTSNGISLNDTQHSGPPLQDNLVDIILRFRRYAVAITADIKKMFRQVLVDPRHRKWQLILWRESSNEPLRTYQLNTVTYGMASGPFNAIRALKQCAYDNWNVVADASRGAAAWDSILQSFYVDDYLDSVHTTELAINRARDIDDILRQGKFELVKWNSNCTQTITALSGNESINMERTLGDCDTTVLGLNWNPITDLLFFKVKVGEVDNVPTKRTVLSDIARLYDPLGLLAPVVVTAKIIVQKLWVAKLSWDTPLPSELSEVWLKYRESLAALERVRIHRWLGIRETSHLTLHGFCDASMKAYAAVVYIACTNQDRDPQFTIVAAKTKVAPLKGTTIPRLELSAAQLLVKLMENVRQALRLEDTDVNFWTDSMIVLHWIRRQPATLKQFVANRVAYIQSNANSGTWRHIRSELNPADCASRGVPAAARQRNHIWWGGQTLLRHVEKALSEQPVLTSDETQIVNSEVRPITTLLNVGVESQLLMTTFKTQPLPLVERFSRLETLLNTTARIRRFLPVFRGHRSNEVVTAEEKEWALNVHIRQSQGNVFKTEITTLQNHCRVNASSKLLPLDPILDEGGILRVGGRLTRSELPYDMKHPIILSQKCSLARLLVMDAHRRCMHGGIQAMIHYLQSKFWIIHMRRLVKSCIHQCAICRRHSRANEQQQMASLPRSRVTVAPPFTHTGLDYCGPFNVRLGGRRSISSTKTYGAIFVCMATKAVHMELAESLSTQSFIDVFDRFVSRRGICSVLYSDNGTQFVGASRQMRDDIRDWESIYAKQHVASTGTHWKFITPAAPHHGGLWEAAVRSAKKHLYRTIGKQTLRFNQLSTLLVRIEACLNSRPLVPLYDDPSGSFALTPGDFLIGRPLNARPEPPIANIPDNCLIYAQQLQKMFEHFWNRWQREYLTTLQSRYKWEGRRPNLQLGDVVVILNENLPPTHWRIGRIVDVHPGSDGLVRIVTVEYNSERKTPQGMFVKHRCQRPVQKVCRIIDPQTEFLNHEGSAGEKC